MPDRVSVARPVFSFVLPVYDEVGSLDELVRRLSAVLDELDGPSEVILVDDGSSDGSSDRIREICEVDGRFRFIRFSRNFGHQAAISAGLDLAEGDATIIMDSDLQHPPELVPELVARWRDGYDVVYAVRSARAGEPWLKRRLSRGFYALLRRLTRTDVAADAGDFRLVDRTVLHAFRRLRERNRYLRGMFTWVGFRQVGVPYGYFERYAGVPKYTYRRMVRLAVDGLTSFASAPLHVALHLGFAMAALAFLTGIFAIVSKLAGLATLPGWVSIMAGMSFIGGVQLLVLGVVGVYIGRMYDELKKRPLYVVAEAEGFDRPPVVEDASLPSPSTEG